jgi:hypothetical protein
VRQGGRRIFPRVAERVARFQIICRSRKAGLRIMPGWRPILNRQRSQRRLAHTPRFRSVWLSRILNWTLSASPLRNLCGFRGEVLFWRRVGEKKNEAKLQDEAWLHFEERGMHRQNTHTSKLEIRRTKPSTIRKQRADFLAFRQSRQVAENKGKQPPYYQRHEREAVARRASCCSFVSGHALYRGWGYL